MVSVILRNILHLFCLLGLSVALLGGCLHLFAVAWWRALMAVSAGLACFCCLRGSGYGGTGCCGGENDMCLVEVGWGCTWRL